MPFSGSREYHVQFFGDAAERGWISKANLLEFKGQAQFIDYCKEVYAKAKSKKDLARLKKWYEVPAHRKKAVDIGIAAAETALPLSRNERKAQYTFTYKLPKSKKSLATELSEISEDLKIIREAEKATSHSKPAKKRKHSEVASPSKAESSKKRKVEMLNSDSPSKSPKKRTSTGVQRNTVSAEGSFDVFCQKERENVLSEHPEFTEDMFMDYCRQQWCMMSKKQKARYKSKYSDETGESE